MSFLGNMWDSFAGTGANPYEAGNKYLNEAKGLYNPYMQQGQDAYGQMTGIGNQLQSQFGQMGQDPSGYLESLMKGYEPSKSYQLKRDEALRSAGNTAAAGGMRGSLSDIQNESRLTDTLLGSDMQSWLQNVMGLQNTGLQGLQGQQGFLNNIYGMGYGASGNQANILGQQANLGINAQNYENNRGMSMLNNLAKLGGTAAGAFFGTNMGGASGGFGGDMGQMFGGARSGMRLM